MVVEVDTSNVSDAVKRIVLPTGTGTKTHAKAKTKTKTKTNESEHERETEPKTKARVVTDTPRWTFSKEDEAPELQYMHLLQVMGKHGGAYQDVRTHIHQKLGGYRAQDIAKARYDPVNVVTYKGILDILLGTATATAIALPDRPLGELPKPRPIPCFYCREGVLLVYRDQRHPKQWTLERMDNTRGHVFDNVVIACLGCNVRRRTMYHERYVMTKQMVVHKVG